MGEQPQANRKAFGAVIFLKDGRLPTVEGLVSEFNRRWQGTVLASEGRKEDCLYFRSGDFHFAIEIRNMPVPTNVTEGILRHTLHKRRYEKLLRKHNTHFGVVASLDRGRLLDLAGVFTKVIVSMLSLVPAMAVCWLGGVLLCSAREFQDVAESMIRIGSPPLMLWINLVWKPKGQLIHSWGMAQFRAPEIFLAGQGGISQETAEYFFELAHYVLTTDRDILEGETIDGPRGALKIEFVKPSESGKRGLLSFPVRPN